MPVRREDAHHALDLLEQYNAQLQSSDAMSGGPPAGQQERELRAALEKVISIFRSPLFRALLDIQEYYELLLQSEWARGGAQRLLADQRMLDRYEAAHPVGTLDEARSGFIPNAGGLPDADYVIETIELVRGATGFGFSIAGGTDQPHKPNDPNIYITNLVPGGAASADGRLQVNDLVLAVNDVNVLGVTNGEAIGALKKSTSSMKLVVKRPRPGAGYMPESHMEEIILTKSGKGLGFSIAGGVGNEHIAGDNGIYITKLIEGGAAQLDGRLLIGDKLLQVNEDRLDNVTHEQAVQVLKSTPQVVRLLIERQGGLALGPGPFPSMQPPQQNWPSNVHFAPQAELQPGPIPLPMPAALPVLPPMPPPAPMPVPLPQPAPVPMPPPPVVPLPPPKPMAKPPPQPPPEPEPLPPPLPPPEVAPRTAIAPTNMAPPVKPPPKPQKPAPPHPPIAAKPPPPVPQLHDDVRRVILRRGPAGLGFNIMGGEDPDDGIFISHLVPGGAADISGQLQKGDLILEAGGVDLRGATHDAAANALKAAGNEVELVVQYLPVEFEHFERKLQELQAQEAQVPMPPVHPPPPAIPSLPPLPPPGRPGQQQQLYVRSLFDYDPTKDSDMPGKGVAFRFGDILAILNSSDDEWWRASRVRPVDNELEPGPPGIIPSRKRVERKERSRQRRIGWGANQVQNSPDEKVPAGKKDKDKKDEGADAATGPIYSYEQVRAVEVDYARPVIVLGPIKDRINDELIGAYPEKFGTCVPHTSRPMRPGEIDGREYHFVASREQMEREIADGLFIEAGHFAGNLYGTSVSAVNHVARDLGRHCLLDVSANAIKRLEQNSLLAIAILIKPNSIQPIIVASTAGGGQRMADDQARKALERAHKLEQEFMPQFTAVVGGDTFEELYARVLVIIEGHGGPLAWRAISSAETSLP